MAKKFYHTETFLADYFFSTIFTKSHGHFFLKLEYSSQRIKNKQRKYFDVNESNIIFGKNIKNNLTKIYIYVLLYHPVVRAFWEASYGLVSKEKLSFQFALK